MSNKRTAEKIKYFISNLLLTNKNYINSLLEARKLSANLSYNVNELYTIIHNESSPVFVLSTGRCGTQLITNLFDKQKHNKVFHNPHPELTYYANYAYQHYPETELLKPIIDCARYELIRNAFLLGETYIETNNRITFFAYALKELFPHAKFIHLLRHPFPFVKSGLSRGWYKNNKIIEEGRIRPGNEKKLNQFYQYNQVQKIAWTWNETNTFIKIFGETMNHEKFLCIKAEDLFSDVNTASLLFNFIGIQNFSVNKLKRAIKKPVNVNKKTGRTLTDQEKRQIVEQTPLAQKYYNII